MTSKEVSQIIKEAAGEARKKLDLSGRNLASLPSEVWQLQNLIWLDLSGNSLTILPAQIGQLQNLTWLDLSSNKFKGLPVTIGKLQKLTWLNLNKNSLTSFPMGVTRLKGLTWLSINKNKLRNLPSKIHQLCNLVQLSLHTNQLKHLPSEIGQLENLADLDLHSNQLSKLPMESAQLKSLVALNLARNQFVNFPEEISQLENLAELNLSDNQLIDLPLEAINLPRLVELNLSNNHLSIPSEFIDTHKEPATIFDYHKKLQVETQKPLNEVKILILGQGNVGKTSLVRRLIENTFDPQENKTEGIGIRRWDVEINDQKIRLNLWDFGGQEIMHATHQFFLTKRSLYLLVVDARSAESENRIEYWLKIIQSFGDNSPVIIVANKVDQHPLDIDRQGLRNKYANIKSIIEISCATGQGLESLRDLVLEEIRSLDHIYEALPLSWFKVRERLDQVGQDYISYHDYEKICQSQNIKDPRSQSNLISLLHDLGAIINFRDDPRLEDTNILNPEWITNGIYKILNDIHLMTDYKGILEWEMCNRILSSDKYPKDKWMFVIDMMKRFELCFPLETSDDRQFLIPDLLPKEEPYTGDWHNALAFQYHYTVLPNSIISRFIVRMHYRIHRACYWRRGVVLSDGRNTALVKADSEEKKILIRVKGCHSTRRDLLSQIRTHFDYIHATTFKRETLMHERLVKEYILLPDHPELILDYEELLFTEAMGETSHPIPKLQKRIDLQELLNRIDSLEARRERVSIIVNNHNYHQYGGGDNIAGDKAMRNKNA